MAEANMWVVGIATFAAFIASAGYYMVLGNAMAKLQATKPGGAPESSMPPWKIGVELLRTFVVTLVITYLLAHIGTGSWAEGMAYALWLWAGFPVVLLLGSVIHEGVAWKLAAVHAGDWLIKLVLIASIASVLR